ncbi:MAG: hypothetical protein EBS01_02590 [Verrucomicrobia bacterium]|nr:hypothetical protein [Verrucomicrobiota bacterium]
MTRQISRRPARSISCIIGPAEIDGDFIWNWEKREPPLARKTSADLCRKPKLAFLYRCASLVRSLPHTPMTPDETRSRLLQLEPAILAEALLALAERDTAAHEFVLQLTASPGEKLCRFRSKITGLRRTKKMIWRRDSAGFARELQAMLEMLADPGIPPKAGLDAAVLFFESDASVFERCDDSSGVLGSVFRTDATHFFVRFASQFEDKEALAAIVKKLMLGNAYGARDRIPDRAAEFLPANSIRQLAAEFLDLATQAAVDSDAFFKRVVASQLAQALSDPDLYLKINTNPGCEPAEYAVMDVAEMHLKNGDAHQALGWLERLTPERTIHSYKKAKLLTEIHQALGNKGELERMAREALFKHPSTSTMESLLALVGTEQRPAILSDVSNSIFRNTGFSATAAVFLAEAGLIGEADAYILERRTGVSGTQYERLLPLASRLAHEGRTLAATVLYRAMLEAILEPALYAAYGPAAHHLHKLATIASQITDWQTLEPHAAYAAHIRARHSRKTSFWARHAELAEKA